MTPHSDLEFTNLKSPVDNLQDKHGSFISRKFGPSRWADRFAVLGNVAQVVILASMGLYAYGQLLHFSDVYTKTISSNIGEWFGVPPGGGKNAGGHSEMVRPMFFFLFCFIPMAVSILLLEFLRHFNVRRISSSYVLNLARFLRCKPRIMGRVINRSLGDIIFLAFLIGGNIYIFQYFYRSRVE
ncbi:Hypothetical protein PHPALM_10595, partial [Phytophthora palmivora]